MMRLFTTTCLLFALSGLSCREGENTLDRRQELAVWIRGSIQEKIDTREICNPVPAPGLLPVPNQQDRQVLSSTAPDVFSWEVQDVVVIHDDGPQYLGIATVSRTLVDPNMYMQAIDSIGKIEGVNELGIQAILPTFSLGRVDVNDLYSYEKDFQASVEIMADGENAYWESNAGAFMGCSHYDGLSMIKVFLVWMHQNGLLR